MFALRKWRNCTILVMKAKTLISFAVTVMLICVFVFAFAYCWISHAKAQMIHTYTQISHIMRKPMFCICNTVTAQLISAFVFAIDTKSTISQLFKSKISSL